MGAPTWTSPKRERRTTVGHAAPSATCARHAPGATASSYSTGCAGADSGAADVVDDLLMQLRLDAHVGGTLEACRDGTTALEPKAGALRERGELAHRSLCVLAEPLVPHLVEALRAEQLAVALDQRLDAAYLLDHLSRRREAPQLVDLGGLRRPPCALVAVHGAARSEQRVRILDQVAANDDETRLGQSASDRRKPQRAEQVLEHDSPSGRVAEGPYRGAEPPLAARIRRLERDVLGAAAEEAIPELAALARRREARGPPEAGFERGRRLRAPHPLDE